MTKATVDEGDDDFTPTITKKGSGTLTFSGVLPSGVMITVEAGSGNVTIPSSTTYTRGGNTVVASTDEGAGTVTLKYVALNSDTGDTDIELSATSEVDAESEAALYTVTLTEAQTTEGLVQSSYYQPVATYNETTGKYYVTVEFADSVAPTLETENGMTVTSSTVSFGVNNFKKGLYYGLETGTASGSVTTVGNLSQATDDSGTGVTTLTADMPDSGVEYFKVIVSDTKTVE